MEYADFVIIGGGIAGSSAAAELSENGRVIVLERESQIGYHSTGRSAACYEPADGVHKVRNLIMAGGSFLSNPPENFSVDPLLSPRGSLCLFSDGQDALMNEHLDVMSSTSGDVQIVDFEEMVRRVPVIKQGYVAQGIYSDSTQDIDVHALHQAYIQKMRTFGGQLVVNAEVINVRRSDEGKDWIISTSSEEYKAPTLINAAGAWCDVIAKMAGVNPIGLEPRRRSAVLVKTPNEIDVSGWPIVFGMDPLYYFKPEAGLLMVSAMDQIPSPPCDARPEDLDIAVAIDRLEMVSTLDIRRLEHSWAGLRSFVTDEMLVSGFDANHKGFFWLTGQGGYGIETSPAMGAITGALAAGNEFPEWVAKFGLQEEDLSPNRASLNH